MKKKLFCTVFIAIILVLTVCLTACSPSTDGTDGSSDSSGTSSGSGQTVAAISENTFDDEDYETEDEGAVSIVLSDNGITSSNPSAVTISGSTASIVAAGDYIISGSLSDGNLVIDSDDSVVHLFFNNCSVHCSTTSPVYVKKAERVIITLVSGTENTLSDGTSYVLDAAETEPDATLFSKSDLTINGEGSLSVSANYADGIKGKDVLKLMSGTISVTAADDGIVGRDALYVNDGSITIVAAGDGYKATNDEDASLGFVVIAGGSSTVSSSDDGIDAVTDILVSGGSLSITAGGGSNASGSEVGKGIKSASALTISGGVITVNAADDALHSDVSLTVSGGTLDLASGDDGIHADSSLTVSGGDVNVTKSYEGLESATITLSGGNISIYSDDDGINAADGSSSSGAYGFGMSSSSSASLTLSGANLFINSTGDGLDSNGKIVMTSGVAVVVGPSQNDNGYLDYDTTFSLTGGYLIACGSSGMLQTPSSSSSSQYFFTTYFTSNISANTAIGVFDSSGNSVCGFVSPKAYKCVTISTPAIAKGTYTLNSGCSVSDEVFGGLYSTASGGTKKYSFTISNVATSVGGNSNSGGMGGGMFR